MINLPKMTYEENQNITVLGVESDEYAVLTEEYSYTNQVDHNYDHVSYRDSTKLNLHS